MSTTLRFLLDEHLRGPLWSAIERQNPDPAANPVLACRVGDFDDLPLGTDDPAILLWIERENWILVSCDRQTMPAHVRDHLREGGHLPGVLILPNRFSIREVVAYLSQATRDDPSKWKDKILYL